MAIVKCRECGKDVSTKAKACPHCGVNKPGRKSSVPTVIVLLVLVVTFFVIYGFTDAPETNDKARTTPVTATANPASSPAKSAPVVAQSVPVKAAPVPSKPKSEWVYQTRKDPMTSKVSKFASVLSSSTLSFSFPYNGEQYATLTFRRHPRYGFDALLSIERGQFQCNSYDGCRVLVRIDQGKAVTYNANEPDDNSTNVLFISNAYGLFRRLKHAKTLHIAATFFQEGSHVMTFNVEGLEPKKMSK